MTNCYLTNLRESIQDEGSYMLIISKGSDEVIEVNTDQFYSNQFDFGNLSYNDSCLAINGVDDYLIEKYDDGTLPFIQIVLINDITNEVVDVSRFQLENNNQRTLRK